MEHPLIGDITHLTPEELGDKVSDLYNKLSIAQRSGNGHLCNQLRMAIETYNNQYQLKLREQWNKSSGNVDFSDKIKIK